LWGTEQLVYNDVGSTDWAGVVCCRTAEHWCTAGSLCVQYAVGVYL